MKKLVFACSLLLATLAFSMTTATAASPDWIYYNGEWIWDGDLHIVTHIHDNGAVHLWRYDYETGEYTYRNYLGSRKAI